MPLLRRVDNADIIEHTAIVRGLDLRNLKDNSIGQEIAKYLQQRLNLIANISQKNWKVSHKNDYFLTGSDDKLFPLISFCVLTTQRKDFFWLFKVLERDIGEPLSKKYKLFNNVCC